MTAGKRKTAERLKKKRREGKYYYIFLFRGQRQYINAAGAVICGVFFSLLLLNPPHLSGETVKTHTHTGRKVESYKRQKTKCDPTLSCTLIPGFTTQTLCLCRRSGFSFFSFSLPPSLPPPRVDSRGFSLYTKGARS